MSCQAKKENSNVLLTDFTTELISMYINDIDNLEAKNRNDDIIIISVTDTLHYYLSVFANNSKEYRFCRDDFVGQTLHLGHLIKVFGDESSAFYSVKENNKLQKQYNDNFTEYDPSIWQVCLYKDQSFCKMRTYRVTANEDITAIQSLAEKYFKVSETIENDVYQPHEVENNPKFLLGEDTLRHIISSNFRIHKKGNFGKIPIVVGIVVDKNGKATLSGIIKSSNDTALDDEAVRVIEIICQYDFIPALHRGEKVNVIYPVVFLIDDIVKNNIY
jgi:hypothetical protein